MIGPPDLSLQRCAVDLIRYASSPCSSQVSRVHLTARPRLRGGFAKCRACEPVEKPRSLVTDLQLIDGTRNSVYVFGAETPPRGGPPNAARLGRGSGEKPSPYFHDAGRAIPSSSPASKGDGSISHALFESTQGNKPSLGTALINSAIGRKSAHVERHREAPAGLAGCFDPGGVDAASPRAPCSSPVRNWALPRPNDQSATVFSTMLTITSVDLIVNQHRSGTPDQTRLNALKLLTKLRSCGGPHRHRSGPHPE
jgi:hypothetical protein